MRTALNCTLLLCVILVGCRDDRPEQKAEAVVEIQTKYWACTDSYLKHHYYKAGGAVDLKLGRSSYDYWTCNCKQWTAHMVGQPIPATKPCSNGWMPEAR